MTGAAGMRTLSRSAWGGEELREVRDAAGRRLAWIATAAALALVLAQLALWHEQALQLVDEGEILGHTQYMMALHSGWGTGWLVATVAALFACVVWFPGRQGPRLGWRLPPLASLAVAATIPMSGHPRALHVGPLIGVLGGAIHLLGAGLWLGGLGILMLIAWLGAEPGRDERAAALIRRFSALATVAAPVTIGTGLLLAWATVGSFSALLATSYGRTLDLKLLGVLVVAALGGYHFKVSVPRLSTDPADPSFRRTARIEVAVGCLILIATAVLVALPAPGLD